jgi:hypothetical protein
VSDSFDSARQGLDETGASDDTRALVEVLASHGVEEGALLARYQRFENEASAPETRYLVKIILDDERRHHRLMVEMANALAWGLSRQSPDPAVPDMTYGDADSVELADETKRLLDAEERDRVELKALQRRLRPFKDITLWQLLVDLMLLDTEKHARILRFILAHQRRSAP